MNNVPISFLIFVVTHHAYMHLILIIKNLFNSFPMSYDFSKKIGDNSSFMCAFNIFLNFWSIEWKIGSNASGKIFNLSRTGKKNRFPKFYFFILQVFKN